MQLSDTKSLDRKQTLLHYIAHVVETVYPNVLSFYDDLAIEEACQGMYCYMEYMAILVTVQWVAISISTV